MRCRRFTDCMEGTSKGRERGRVGKEGGMRRVRIREREQIMEEEKGKSVERERRKEREELGKELE